MLISVEIYPSIPWTRVSLKRKVTETLILLPYTYIDMMLKKVFSSHQRLALCFIPIHTSTLESCSPVCGLQDSSVLVWIGMKHNAKRVTDVTVSCSTNGQVTFY